ncbi:hypothetical protein ACHAWF_003481 [Thalassiosira exigua]
MTMPVMTKYCPGRSKGANPRFKPRRSTDATASSHSFASSTIASVHDPRRLREGRNANVLAAEAAEDSKSFFRESLPLSLRDEDKCQLDDIALFQPDEIILGPKLGTGEFSNVYEVESFLLRLDYAGNVVLQGKDEAKKRLRMKNDEKYRESENARYALKHIKENYLQKNGNDAYVQAASDLAIEAEFLANLNHPNIIKLRGLAHSGALGFANGPCGYFLVIDRLRETLDQRIKTWHGPTAGRKSSKMARMPKFISARSSSLPTNSTTSASRVRNDSIKRNDIMDECLSVALQIAAGLKYLHSHSIIFRDLKPDNVGFDVRGDVKIFDFGLARTVPDGGDPYNDRFDMSGAGSPRYMAPECLVDKGGYNLRADLYTFALVLWQMLTGKVPYSSLKNMEELISRVVLEGRRPAIDPSWPSHVQGMMESSFDVDASRRPKMSLFFDIIRRVLAALRGSAKNLTDSHINRRRSDASMSGSFVDKVKSLGEEVLASLRDEIDASEITLD